MRKSRWTALALAVGLMLYAGAAAAEATPLIYKVSDEKGHVLYLLGTIHVGEESMYPLGPAAEAAYQAADALAVEMDVAALTENVAKMTQYSLALMYGAQDSAKAHLSPTVYALGVEKLGLPEAVLSRMRTAAWLSLAQEQAYARIGQSSQWGVDSVLLSRAHQDGKRIDELEGLTAQMETLLAMPDEIVEMQLEQMLVYPEATDISLKLLSAAWRQGNEEILSLLLAQEEAAMPPEYSEIYAEYAQTLYHDRNAAFEQKAAAYLQSGETVLMAVGAAHITGEDALAGRLARAGYTVEEIGR